MLKFARLLIGVQNAILSLMHWAMFRQSGMSDDPKSILVLRTAALGDFVIAIPALAVLRRKFPQARIGLLTASTTQAEHKQRVARYVGNPAALPWTPLVHPSLVDEVFAFGAAPLKEDIRQLRPRLADFAPDVAFVLNDPGVPLKGVIKKLGFLKLLGVRGPVYGCRVRSSRAVFMKEQHEGGYFDHHVVGVLRCVAEHPTVGPVENLRIEFPLTIPREADEWASKVLETNGLSAKRVVAIAPGSVLPHKRWPLERFVELSRQLLSGPASGVVVVGTKLDFELGEAIRSSSGPSVLNLAGATTIVQLAALLRRCSLLVGNDGGAMHLGAAVGCRVVSIVPGIEFPNSIEPWGNIELAVRHSVPCAPCYSFTHCPLGHANCMKELPVVAVHEKCRSAMDAGAREQ